VYDLRDDRALPSSRAALYERFVDHLLDGRRSLDRFRDAVEPELLSRGVTGKALADWLTSDLHWHVGGLLEAAGIPGAENEYPNTARPALLSTRTYRRGSAAVWHGWTFPPGRPSVSRGIRLSRMPGARFARVWRARG
jgi:hypothetical protein